MKKTGIVDVTLFYEPYGVEMLDFRVNLLKDSVDWFIITESNRTHSGDYGEYKFMETAERLGLPMEKIIYLQCDIPLSENIRVEDSDVVNAQQAVSAGAKLSISESALSRARERMHRNRFMDILSEFDEDTVFIVSDLDEVIKPDSIPYLSGLCRSNRGVILKVPLRNLQGRADLQVHHRDTNLPDSWDKSMFLCQPHHLRKNSANNIRSNILLSYQIVYATHGGKVIRDLGWHFSWMGSPDKLLSKAISFPHSSEDFEWNAFGAYNSDEFAEFIIHNKFRDGSTPPSGHKRLVLRKYGLEELPDLMFTKREYIEFFFGLD